MSKKKSKFDVYAIKKSNPDNTLRTHEYLDKFYARSAMVGLTLEEQIEELNEEFEGKLEFRYNTKNKEMQFLVRTECKVLEVPYFGNQNMYFANYVTRSTPNVIISPEVSDVKLTDYKFSKMITVTDRTEVLGLNDFRLNRHKITERVVVKSLKDKSEKVFNV